MNILTPAVLYWTLLGLLLVWMVICAILAFRPEPGKRAAREEARVPDHALAYVSSPAMLQVITSQPVPVPVHSGTETS